MQVWDKPDPVSMSVFNVNYSQTRTAMLSVAICCVLTRPPHACRNFINAYIQHAHCVRDECCGVSYVQVCHICTGAPCTGSPASSVSSRHCTKRSTITARSGWPRSRRPRSGMPMRRSARLACHYVLPSVHACTHAAPYVSVCVCLLVCVCVCMCVYVCVGVGVCMYVCVHTRYVYCPLV